VTKKVKNIKMWMITLLALIFIFECSYIIVNKNNSKPIKTIKDKALELFNPNVVNKNEAYGVSSANPLATEVGMKVLEQGGNAVDAAVAISFALAVVEPYGSGLGGGGGMLIYDSKKDAATFLNYREIAPFSKDKKASEIGVPGFVKGLEQAVSKYGKLPMSELMKPAIGYAENGYSVSEDLHYRLLMAKNGMNIKVLPQFYPNGKPINEGEKVVQKELASTLKLIQSKGSDAFYKGTIADAISSNTVIAKGDLESYTVSELKPIYSTWGEYSLITAPPPFSGITLSQMLKLSEKVKIPNPQKDMSTYIKRLDAIKNITYKDRYNNIGDPNYYNKAYDNLVSDEHIQELYDKLAEKDDSIIEEEEHESTTHFVVIDKNGMVVTCTNTISNFFGSKVYVKGFFMNSTFSAISNNSNLLNGYEPGKRPRTFTSPTVITKGDSFIMGIGSAGGERIPEVITEVLLNYFKAGEGIQDSISHPRLVISNNTIVTEEELPESIEDILKNGGYSVEVKNDRFYYGAVQSLILNRDENKIYGGADPRRHGVYKTNQ